MKPAELLLRSPRLRRLARLVGEAARYTNPLSSPVAAELREVARSLSTLEARAAEALGLAGLRVPAYAR